MTEGRKDGMTESPTPGLDGKTLSIADFVLPSMASVAEACPAWGHLAFFDLFKDTVKRLRQDITTERVGEIAWPGPLTQFAQLDFEVTLPEAPADLSAEHAAALVKDILKANPDFLYPRLMAHLTKGVVRDEEGRRIILPDDLDKEVAGLPEDEQYRDARVAGIVDPSLKRWLRDCWFGLGAGFELPPWKLKGTVDTPAGKSSFAAVLGFAIRPLTIELKRHRAFFPIQVGLDITEGDPSAFSEEDREAIWSFLIEQIDALAAPYLKELKAKGEERPAVPKPIRAEYFHAPGRLFDTPRNAAKQGDLPAIGRWYLQTAFNRTVGMAAAALTKTDTRDAILDWQSATVADIADLVFCRSEEGTPAHGQNREDILKAFEALRAIPVPIVKIDWKQIGTDRNPRWVKE